MGIGRWPVVFVLFAAACGGKSVSQSSGDGHPNDLDGGTSTERDCKTSFACPTGERCDDGACVPDDDCPGGRDPELLHEAPAESPWAEVYNTSFTVLEGREYLVWGERDESGAFGSLSRFLDLRTGGELLFVHEPGYAGCYGTPARCRLRSRGEPAIAEVVVGGDTVAIRAEAVFIFPGYEMLLSSDADYRDRRVIASAGTLVQLYELGRAAPIASIDLEGKSLQSVIVGADGRSESIVSWVQENRNTEEAAEVAVSALETGARPTLIYRGPGGPMWGVMALPDGDDWFALRDGRLDEPAVFVYRTDGTVVGTLDSPWAMGVDYEYRTRERPLEPGPSAYVRHCDESGCASHRFHLDPVSLVEVARVALPEPGLREHFSRAIACGGADLWVVPQATAGAPTRYWSMRIPGRAGFP